MVEIMTWKLIDHILDINISHRNSRTPLLGIRHRGLGDEGDGKPSTKGPAGGFP